MMHSAQKREEGREKREGAGVRVRSQGGENWRASLRRSRLPIDSYCNRDVIVLDKRYSR
jgi:hypothetical protein